MLELGSAFQRIKYIEVMSMIQKNIYKVVLFTAVLCWSLWNYEVSLAILGSAYDIIFPFLVGIFIAFIVNVLMTKLEYIWEIVFSKGPLLKLKRPACMVLSFLLIFAVLAFTLILVVPELQHSIRTLGKLIPPAMVKLNAFLHAKAVQFNVSEADLQQLQEQWLVLQNNFLQYIQSNKSLLLSRTWSATTSVVGVITELVIGFVAAVYVLLEKEELAQNAHRTIYAFFAKDRAEYLVNAARTTHEICTGFVGGQLLVAFLLGCMCFVGMLILGLPYALVESVLVGVLALIPILGTFFSAAIGCFLILVAAPDKIWYFVILFLLLQRIEGDLLYPRIVGKSVGLSELWVLAAVTIGASIGGIIGMILCVPLFSVIYRLLSQKVAVELDKKQLNGM